MSLSDVFIKHPQDAGESYWQHLCFTLRAGCALIVIGLVLLIHGIFPFLFVHTASCKIESLCDELQARRKKCEETKRQEAA